MHHRVDTVSCQPAVHNAGQRVDAHGEQVRQKCADRAEGHPEHKRQNPDEAGQRRILAGQDAVDGNAALVFPALGRVHDRLGAEFFNKGKAHIGQGGLTVKAAFGLHLGHGMFEQVLLVLLKVQRFQNQRVALHELGGGKARRQPGAAGVVFDQVDDRMDTAVHGTGFVPVLVPAFAKVDAAGRFAVARHMDGMVDQFVDAFVFGRRNRHHRDAQQFLQPVDQDGPAIGAHFVHHVERQHHRDAQLHQLHGQIEVALDVGGIHNVNDAAGFLLQQKVAGDKLLARIGRQRIDTRQVGDCGFVVAADHAVLAVDRHAREVADMLVGAGQLVEQRRLAAVLVARKGKGQRLAFRDRLAGFVVMVAGRVVQFAAAGVRHRRMALFFRFCAVARVDIPYIDLPGIVQAQRQLIAAQFQFDRVAHRRDLAQRDLGARGQPHIQQMAAQRAAPAYCIDDGILSYFQFRQCHGPSSASVKFPCAYFPL